MKAYETLLCKMDGSGIDQKREAIANIKANCDGLSTVLMDAYLASSKWNLRADCVHYAMFECRRDPVAVDLGIAALKDRSAAVRFAACKLLAVSLDTKAIVPLKDALCEGKYPKSAEDIRAALDAIEQQNHNLFLDRDHSGKITLNVRGVT